VTDPILLFMPALNEVECIASVVARVPATVLGHPIRCLVIDDGSTDDTAAAARAAGAEVVRFSSNRGLGAAVRAGLATAAREGVAAVAFCDADGEYAPEELERLVAPILDGSADYVVGSRFAQGWPATMRPHRMVGNRVLTQWVRHLTGLAVTDGQSGYRAFSPTAAAAAEVIHDFNYAQVLTLDLVAKGFHYAEVPISYRFRTTGESFVKLGPYLRQVIPAVRAERRSLPVPQADPVGRPAALEPLPAA
jgi:glycosyltransferase involved in cell wall biosynthesis